MTYDKFDIENYFWNVHVCLTIELHTWDHSNWINLLLTLISYHLQKANFITQIILEIKLTHKYLSSLSACPGIPDHTYVKQETNICCFHGSLVTSWIFCTSSYLWDIVLWRVWLVLRFLDHNSRARFFPKMLFSQNFNRPFAFLYWSQKAYL